MPPIVDRYLGGLAFALALTLGAAGAGAATPPAEPPPVTVKIGNFVFNPVDLAVPVGTTVTWVNEDDVPHTVVSDDKASFRSKVLDTDEKFSFTFTKAGSYPYFCSIHPHMTGKVTVTPPKA